MKNLILAIILLCAMVPVNAQESNYLFTNVSYAFFGTGDLQGSAVGLDYHKTIWKNIGVNVGFSRASGNSGESFLFAEPSILANATLTGDNGFVEGIAVYNTFLLGASYKVSEGRKQVLIVAVGVNYKTLKYNYIGATLFENISQSGQAEAVNILSYNFVSDQEIGIYGSLDYHFYVNSAVSLGVHLAVENSSNILSKAGLSVGYRF